MKFVDYIDIKHVMALYGKTHDEVVDGVKRQIITPDKNVMGEPQFKVKDLPSEWGK